MGNGGDRVYNSEKFSESEGLLEKSGSVLHPDFLSSRCAARSAVNTIFVPGYRPGIHSLRVVSISVASRACRESYLDGADQPSIVPLKWMSISPRSGFERARLLKGCSPDSAMPLTSSILKMPGPSRHYAPKEIRLFMADYPMLVGMLCRCICEQKDTEFEDPGEPSFNSLRIGSELSFPPRYQIRNGCGLVHIQA